MLLCTSGFLPLSLPGTAAQQTAEVVDTDRQEVD